MADWIGLSYATGRGSHTSPGTHNQKDGEDMWMFLLGLVVGVNVGLLIFAMCYAAGADSVQRSRAFVRARHLTRARSDG